MYVKALAILLLLSGLIAGCWKLYDAGGDAREDQIKRAYAEKEAQLLKELAQARTGAESRIIEEKVIWRDRIQKVREVVTDCTLPDIHIGVLRESGVFKAGEVRDPVNR